MTISTTFPFGASIKRREDPRLISGLGTYVDDIKMVGMLHLALVRSPYAHAYIVSVDTSAAKAAEGVVAVYTGEELADQLGSLICGWVVPDTKEVPHPPLAIGKVRCVGRRGGRRGRHRPLDRRRRRRARGRGLRAAGRRGERRGGHEGRRAAGTRRGDQQQRLRVGGRRRRRRPGRERVRGARLAAYRQPATHPQLHGG